MMAIHSEHFGGVNGYDMCVVKLWLVELSSSSLLPRKIKFSYLKTQWNIWSSESLGAKLIQWTVVIWLLVVSCRQFGGKDEGKLRTYE